MEINAIVTCEYQVVTCVHERFKPLFIPHRAFAVYGELQDEADHLHGVFRLLRGLCASQADHGPIDRRGDGRGV